MHGVTAGNGCASNINKIIIVKVKFILTFTIVFRSAGSNGSEGRFRSSEVAFKQRSVRQCREWLHTPSHGGKMY